jgi:hypothetical protein
MSAITPTPIQFRWYLSVAAILFIFVIVGVYSSRMASNTDETDSYDQQQAQERLTKLHKMQDTDRKTLTTADWIDQDKGIVRIPIDEAMTEEVAVLKARPVTMGAIPVVVPAAAEAAPTATNAAPAAPTGELVVYRGRDFLGKIKVISGTNAASITTNAATAANPHPTK